MDKHLLPIWDDIAEHDAKIDEQFKKIMTRPAPRKAKVILTTPNGIDSKPHAKPSATLSVDKVLEHPRKRTSPEARRAALERKQF